MSEEKKQKSVKIAVVRIRGIIGIRKVIKDTLNMLRLFGKNHCVVLEATDSNIGMIKKIKDYVTYGEISDETFKLLVEKKGEHYQGTVKDHRGKIDYSSRFFVFNSKKYKKYFRLNPPKGGFERKGIKMPFAKGGVLGFRGEKINDLIKRML